MDYLDSRFLLNYGIHPNDMAKYAIPYYALSRGLRVSFFNKENINNYYYSYGDGGFFEIDDGVKSYKFNYSKLISSGQELSIEKLKKDNIFNYLKNLGLKSPLGKKYSINDSVEKVYLDISKYPVVVKPVIGSMGKNVYPKIKNKDDLIFAIKNQTSDYLIEEHISGDEYRIYTVSGKPVAFCKRERPIIIGDGLLSIEDLIINKNKLKNSLGHQKIKINTELSDFLKTQNKNIHDILKKDEVVLLSNKRGRSSGGEITQSANDINDTMFSELERLAKNLSDFFVLGIDCIISDGSLYILEVNCRPQITSALLPDNGSPVDLPRIIIDNLFGNYDASLNKPVNFKRIIRHLYSNSLEWNNLSFKDQDVSLSFSS
ncbi:ATP-grasp domain-containing protein [Vibrio metschnikovii]|uniref:ATP-grasp domain-containing protein n=1 Tax=Vibrio metschnikovii TaxID=28172 RepID=UPI001302E084|nr:ATP-grasp domain-containing protein [Vibrio metschnikovii]